MWLTANVLLRSDDGEILGGALGNTWGRWLYVSDLWVDPAMRGKGYATKLMTAIEQLAAQRECVNSYLDTFSFQARPLYEKLGYKVFGTLENHPKGHSHYFPEEDSLIPDSTKKLNIDSVSCELRLFPRQLFGKTYRFLACTNYLLHTSA